MQRISPKPYRTTLAGRVDGLRNRVRRGFRTIGGGSVALAIGALGAALLLATTLVFPDTIQRVLSLRPEGGFPARTRERVVQEPIRVSPTPGQRNELPSGSSRVSRASGGDPVGATVLGTRVEKDAPATDSKQNDVEPGGTSGGGAPVAGNDDDRDQEWASDPEGGSGTPPSKPDKDTDQEWSGSGGSTPQPSPSTAPTDPDEDDEWSS